MTQVVLIRPGATVYDEQNRVQGVLDIPLSERGLAEVALLAERLAGVELAAPDCRTPAARGAGAGGPATAPGAGAGWPGSPCWPSGSPASSWPPCTAGPARASAA